jgi:ABC-type uncharacterized transport system fused permease/ATPase subunit
VESAPELKPEDVEKARKGYLLKRFWISARGFWGAAGNRLAWPLSIALLLLIIANVAFQYGINVWNRLIFDGIEKRDAATVFRLTGIFFPIAIGSVLLGVAQVFTRMSIQRRWRAWATHAVVSRWLKNGRYYQLNLVGGDHQNPETRIAEDLRIATDSPVDFVSGVTSALLSAVTFIVVLWTIGGALVLPVGDQVITIPGFLVVAAVLYAATASGSIAAIGRRLVGISEDKNQAEAEYRYVLTRVRENGESIALLGGEAEERAGIDKRFDKALTQWKRLAWQYMRTTLVSQSSSLIAPVVPILLCAPKFLDGSMSLGEVMQPYVPSGTLRRAAAYPAAAEDWTVEQIGEALDKVGLAHLKDKIEYDAPWDQTLSGGEKQRLAFVRLLLHNPDIIVLDEATSALDEKSQDKMMELLTKEMPNATIISVAHRVELEAFHSRKIVLERRRNGAKLVSVSLFHGRGATASSAASCTLARRKLLPEVLLYGSVGLTL